MYVKSSGLAIPDTYLHSPNNHVFGIYWKKELIGGFILGNGPSFRTVELFAQAPKQEDIYEKLEDCSSYTEICCFYIQRKYRTKTTLNFFTWFAMAYALKRFGNKNFLFGTCSRSLAKLYGQTQKSVLINRDFINNKSTFIFKAKQADCLHGMFEIIRHKMKRVLKTSKFAGQSLRSRYSVE